MRYRSAASALAFLFVSGTVAPAAAQSIPDRLPASTDPGRIERRLEPPRVSSGLETEAPNPVASAPVLDDAPGGFVFRAADFSANTAFSTAALHGLLSPYLGRRIDENAAQVLADYLTAYYRQEGYFLSKVFIESIDADDGIVAFSVVEGYIERVDLRTEGADLAHDGQKIVLSVFEQIRAMKPLHGPTLERKLLLLNDMYGVDVETTLVPLSDMPNPPVGAVGMVATLRRDVRFSTVEFNNYGSVFTGPAQGIYTFNTGTPLNSFDNLKIQMLHAFPSDEMRYVQVEYSLPVGADGLTLAVRANKSLLRPTNNLKPFDLKSDSESVALELSYPLIRSRAENLWLGAGFEMRNSKTDLLATEFHDDRLRVVYTNASYEFMDPAQGRNILGATLTQGLDILGARETGSENLSRREGHSDFTKVEASATHYHPLPHDITVVGGVTGQYAFSQLLSSEEFGYGGQGIGRAYDSSEILGDHGVSAFAEIRYSGLPAITDLNVKLEPYAFYDIGKVWNIENGQAPESGASAGIGARFHADKGVFGNVHAAYPLTRSIENPDDGDGDGLRLFFQVGARF